MLRRHLEIELAFFRALAAAEDDEVVRPRQLCQQCRHYLRVGVSLVKLPHAEQVAAGKAFQPRLGAGQVLGQLFDDTLAPFSGFDLGTEMGAHLPVQLDQRGVDSLIGPLAGAFDEAGDFGEIGGIRV